jgi:hypothetical protein
MLNRTHSKTRLTNAMKTSSGFAGTTAISVDGTVFTSFVHVSVDFGKKLHKPGDRAKGVGRPAGAKGIRAFLDALIG